MPVEFRPVELPHDHDALVAFLGNDEWPFHGHRLLSPTDIAAMDFSSPDVASFWIVEDQQMLGLVRLLELGDIGAGAPRFDLRIASRARGRGIGTRGTRWIVDHLFTTYPELHRIEADTRHDNTAMQRVLSHAGFTHEGRLRESWPSDEGPWFDTMVYGILRIDRTATDDRRALGSSSG